MRREVAGTRGNINNVLELANVIRRVKNTTVVVLPAELMLTPLIDADKTLPSALDGIKSFHCVQYVYPSNPTILLPSGSVPNVSRQMKFIKYTPPSNVPVNTIQNILLPNGFAFWLGAEKRAFPFDGQKQTFDECIASGLAERPAKRKKRSSS